MLILEEIYTELRVGLFNILDWTFFNIGDLARSQNHLQRCLLLSLRRYAGNPCPNSHIKPCPDVVSLLAPA